MPDSLLHIWFWLTEEGNIILEEGQKSSWNLFCLLPYWSQPHQIQYSSGPCCWHISSNSELSWHGQTGEALHVPQLGSSSRIHVWSWRCQVSYSYPGLHWEGHHCRGGGEISSAGASIPNRPLGKCRVGSWHWRVWHDCEACSCHPLCSAIIKSNKHKGKTNSNVKDISMTLRSLTWLQDFVQLPLSQTSTRAKQIQRWCAVEMFGWLQELIYLWSHLDPYVAARISDVIKWCDKTSYLDLFRLKSCSRQDLKSVLKQIVTVRKQPKTRGVRYAKS